MPPLDDTEAKAQLDEDLQITKWDWPPTKCFRTFLFLNHKILSQWTVLFVKSRNKWVYIFTQTTFASIAFNI